MRILVLGATSSIGTSIVKKFAKENELILISSKYEKLNKIKKNALELGCKNIKLIEIDLGRPIDPKKIFEKSLYPDLIINAACSLSKFKDFDVDPFNYKSHTSVNLNGPLCLVEYLIETKMNQGDTKKINYIFINTILTKIKSPDYIIYSSFKLLHQEYLNTLSIKYQDYFNFINVIIGTQIDRKSESKNSTKLANRIESAIKKDENEFIFGIKGKIILFIYNISPVLSKILITLRRLIIKTNK